MTVFITGGAGFIGSNFILDWLSNNDEKIVNIDLLTYAGNLDNLSSLRENKRYSFYHADINDKSVITEIFNIHRPRAILNFAAESHVDRSISNPKNFVETNINGTFNLLECARNYCLELDTRAKSEFRFLQVSTDEVYGSLGIKDDAFDEGSQVKPNSPYSASKAAADHLVRSYNRTFGLATLTTNCSNNYGPYQYPEKLIPLVIQKALRYEEIPVYGDGLQIRDWLHVSDHCRAIRKVLEDGRSGEVYNIGGNEEKTNIELVNKICSLLDELRPPDNKSSIKTYIELIQNVKDRPGHDRRYAVNTSKITKELGWSPSMTFDLGLRNTVMWYLENEFWLKNLYKKFAALK